MLTLQVHIWAENAGVGVSHWAAETMGIWQENGGFTTQWIQNKMREPIGEIAQLMSISNEQGTNLEQWDVLIDHCVSQISDLVSIRPLRKWYMADKTLLDGQKLKAALHKFAEVAHCGRNNWLEETQTKKSKLVHIGIYFIAPMLLLLFMRMCRCRRRQRRNLRSQIITHRGVLRHLD